jgi:hypothetical protein
MILDDNYKFITNEKGEEVEASLDLVTICQTEIGEIYMPTSYKFKAVELTAEQVCSAYAEPIKIANGLGADKFFYVERAIFSVINQTTPFTDGGDFGVFFNQNEIPAIALGSADKIHNRENVQLKGVNADPETIRGSALYFSNLGAAFKNGNGILRIELFYRELV